MIALIFTLLALPSVISATYELTTTHSVTTLLPTQHRLYRAYELVTSPMSVSDDALRTRFVINLCLASTALLALAVVVNTFA